MSSLSPNLHSPHCLSKVGLHETDAHVDQSQPASKYSFCSPVSSRRVLWFARCTLNRTKRKAGSAMIHPSFVQGPADRTHQRSPRRRIGKQILGFFEGSEFCGAAGHVHAYERSHAGVFKSKRTACAPTYVTIGDGGNREGLSEDYLKKPDWSAVREASFGMGTLTVENGSHAVWRWHRNKDAVAEVTPTLSSLFSFSSPHSLFSSLSHLFSHHVKSGQLFTLTMHMPALQFILNRAFLEGVATCETSQLLWEGHEKLIWNRLHLDGSAGLSMSAMTPLRSCM